MTDFDKLTDAGHILTLVQGLVAGVSTYYCERCGALLQTGPMPIFHLPASSKSREDKCVGEVASPALVARLDERMRRQYASLIEADE